MIVDCHVHVCATMPGHGTVSPRLRRRLSFLFMRWRLGVSFFAGDDQIEREVEARLVQTVQQTPELDAAVVLALDQVYGDDGRPNAADTDLYVTNEYAAEVAHNHAKLLFGASVHPYRHDALAELERCVLAGAVLVKWLPVVQNINPADERCLPFYEFLAHHRLPLLCHTGGELSLPYVNFAYADPELLVPALQRGVTVIAAHCGTRSRPFEKDCLPVFLRLAREHERLYGDTAALNLPTRSYSYEALLKHEEVRRNLVHGSDWPIISVPPARAGRLKALRLLAAEGNWMRRDVLAKQALGFDNAYWHRAATLLRLPGDGG
ncbi:MAG: amidohydrolase family protein [Gemmataceae bacterium]